MRLIHFIAACLFAPFCLLATDYYVATNGNNAANGLTTGTAWSNIWYAATQATTAGDTVHIGAGVFNEYVTNTASGSAGNPITFTGTRDGSGNWLTIIDPSTTYSSGWVAAPEFGTGVWKQASMPFVTRELQIDHKRTAFIYTLGAFNPSYYIYDTVGGHLNSGLTNGFQFFGIDSSGTVEYNGETIPFWDGIEFLWAATNTTTYIRFRDGRDPNGENIACADNRDSDFTSTVFHAAVLVDNLSYVTWSNVMVRGAFGGFEISGSSHNINIVSNKTIGGFSGIVFDSAPSNCVARGNFVDGAYYGTTNIGAFSTDSATATNLMRYHIYGYSKYCMGETTTFGYQLDIANAGVSNVICWNTVRYGLGSGIETRGSLANPLLYTLIYSNLVYNFPSVGIAPMEFTRHTQIFGNEIYDVNLPFRLNRFFEAGETNRLIYIYRNRSWLAPGLGTHAHANSNGVVNAYTPTYWIYNNSALGSYGFFRCQFTTGATNCHILNNLIDNTPYTVDLTVAYTNANWTRSFDYNLIYPALSSARAYFGPNNITNSAAEWSSNPYWSTTPWFSFPIASNSLAVDAALDLFSGDFTVQGETFSALPDLSGTTKVGAAWDIGALEYSAPPIVITNRVQYTEDLWIK